MSKRWAFRVLFAVVLALVGASATLQFERAGQGGAGQGAQEITMLAKMALAGSALPGAPAEAYEKPLLAKLDELGRSADPAERARALRRKAIWCSLRNLGCAAEALDALDRIPAEERRPAPADEVALLREALIGGPIAPERAAALEARLSELRLGWFDRLLREQLHRHAGEPARAREAMDAALRGAVLAMAAVFLFMGLLAAGVVAWLVVLASPARSRIAARLAAGLRARGEAWESAGRAAPGGEAHAGAGSPVEAPAGERALEREGGSAGGAAAADSAPPGGGSAAQAPAREQAMAREAVFNEGAAADSAPPAGGGPARGGAAARRLAVVATFLGGSLVIPLGVRALGLGGDGGAGARAAWTLGLEAALLGLVGCAHLVFTRPAGVAIGFRPTSAGRALGVGGLAYLLLWPVLLVVMLPLGALFERLGLPSRSHPIVEQLRGAMENPGALALWLIIAAVLAPVLEEAVFRGALQGAVHQRLGGWAALLLTALVFAIIHPQVGLGLVGVLLVGLALSLVRIHEGSLWPGVVLHAINNGVALLLATALLSG